MKLAILRRQLLQLPSLMQWLALSPDLDTVGNTSGIMARDVYIGNNKYATLQEHRVIQVLKAKHVAVKY